MWRLEGKGLGGWCQREEKGKHSTSQPPPCSSTAPHPPTARLLRTRADCNGPHCSTPKTTAAQPSYALSQPSPCTTAPALPLGWLGPRSCFAKP